MGASNVIFLDWGCISDYDILLTILLVIVYCSIHTVVSNDEVAGEVSWQVS